MKADYIPYNSYWQLCPMNNNKPQFKDMGFAVRLLFKKKKKKKEEGITTWFWERSIKEVWNISWYEFTIPHLVCVYTTNTLLSKIRKYFEVGIYCKTEEYDLFVISAYCEDRILANSCTVYTPPLIVIHLTTYLIFPFRITYRHTQRLSTDFYTVSVITSVGTH